MTEVKRPKVGVCVIPLREDGCVLLGKRLGAHGEGYWAFPGGHLEFGEEIEECARRELMEETALTAHSVELFDVTNNLFADKTKHYVTLFVLAHVSGEPINTEPESCEGWRWFEQNRLPKPLFATIVSLIEKHDGILDVRL